MKQILIHDLFPLPILRDDTVLPLSFLAYVFSVCGDPHTGVELQAFIFAAVVDSDGGVSCAFDGGGVFLFRGE